MTNDTRITHALAYRACPLQLPFNLHILSPSQHKHNTSTLHLPLSSARLLRCIFGASRYCARTAPTLAGGTFFTKHNLSPHLTVIFAAGAPPLPHPPHHLFCINAPWERLSRAPFAAALSRAQVLLPPARRPQTPGVPLPSTHENRAPPPFHLPPDGCNVSRSNGRLSPLAC